MAKLATNEKELRRNIERDIELIEKHTELIKKQNKRLEEMLESIRKKPYKTLTT